MALLNTIKKGIGALGSQVKNTGIGLAQAGGQQLYDASYGAQKALSAGMDKISGTQGFGLSSTPSKPQITIENSLTPKNMQQNVAKTVGMAAPLVGGVTGSVRAGANLLRAAPSVSSFGSLGNLFRQQPKNTTFAERFANTGSAADNFDIQPGRNYTINPPARNPKGQAPSSNAPLQSGNRLPGDPFPSGFDLNMRQQPGLQSRMPDSLNMKTGAGTRPSPTQKLETKTTDARNSGTIDTRSNPVSAGTVKTRPVVPETPPTPRGFPWGKTALGVGGLGIAGSMLYPGGDNAQPPQTVPPAVPGDETSPFSAPTAYAAPSMTTSSFGTGGAGTSLGTPVGGIGAVGGYGAGGASPLSGINSQSMGGYDDEEKDPREKDLERIFELAREGDGEKKRRQEEENLAAKIARLTGAQDAFEVDLEGSSASAYGKDAQRNLLDRETRRSLIPLQGSLSLIQALRERDEQDRLNEQEALKYRYEQTKPGEPEDTSFTLGEGQSRYQINPQTGQYELVANMPKTYQPKGTTAEEMKLTATQKSKGDSIQNVLSQLDNYKNLISQGTNAMFGGVNMTGSDAAQIRTAKAALEFAIAQAVGTGALQAADRDVVRDMIPDPTSFAGASGMLARGGKGGAEASINEARKIFEYAQQSIGSQPIPTQESSTQVVDGYTYVQGPDGNWYLQE